MKKKAQIINEKRQHQGYLRLSTYQLNIPSLTSKHAVIQLNREVVHSYDSVSVLLYSPGDDSFILCKQFRSGVFFNEQGDDPFILECVAGTIDEQLEASVVAKKEIMEETGIKIEKVALIANFYKSPGFITEKASLFFAEVMSSAVIGFYGVGDEEIQTHIIKRQAVYQLLDNLKILDAATLVALNWFRANKEPVIA